MVQGFNDCISKPIVEEELHYILKKYLKSEDDSTKQTNDTNLLEKPHNLNTAILEEAGINVKSSLIQLKDMNTYNTLLTDFYNELDNNIFSLFEHKNSNNLDKYYVCSSELRKQAQKLGFTKFAEVLAEHEKAAKEKDTEYITNNYSKLKMQSIAVNKKIKEYLGR